MNIIYDKIISSSTFAECYTGKYFTNTSTFEEVKQRLASCCIYIGNGYKLSEIDKIKNNEGDYVIVSFSEENDYTKYEYRVMYIQKKYRKRFKNHLKTEYMYDEIEKNI